MARRHTSGHFRVRRRVARAFVTGRLAVETLRRAVTLVDCLPPMVDVLLPPPTLHAARRPARASPRHARHAHSQDTPLRAGAWAWNRHLHSPDDQGRARRRARITLSRAAPPAARRIHLG